MSDPYVFLLIMDIQNNILILLNNQYTSFLSSTITKNDQSLGNDPIMNAKIATLRIIKDKLRLLTSHERLDDISLYDQNGNKLNVFIHRINDEEKKLILANNISGANFININTLPKNLDMISSSIAQAITNYPDLILNTTTPPSFIPISYPTKIQKFIPSMQVHLLKPKNILIQGNQNLQSSNQPVFLQSIPKSTLPTIPEPILSPTLAQTSPVQEPKLSTTLEPKLEQTPAPTLAPTPEPTLLPVQEPKLTSTSEPKLAPTPEPTLKPKISMELTKPPIFHASEIATSELNIGNNKKHLELERKYLKYKEKYVALKKQHVMTQDDNIKEKYVALKKQHVMTQDTMNGGIYNDKYIAFQNIINEQNEKINALQKELNMYKLNKN